MSADRTAATARARRFVNRREQLEALRARYSAALGGAGSLVIIASDGGAGKTRLVQELCRGIPPAEGRSSVGFCLEYARSPLAPFLTILSSLAREDPDVLRKAPSVRAVLSALLPGIGDTPTPAPSDKLQQFNAIAEALRQFGEAKPTVVVVEDVHWADGATLEFLLHLLPHLESSHTLVVVTYRSDELPKGHMLRSIAAKLERNVTTHVMTLPPLALGDMNDLLFDAQQELGISAETIDAICAQAEGNPLFAEELLKTVGAGGAGGDRPLPATLREAIRERIVDVSDSDRTVLVHAAAIGRRFAPEFLAQIMNVSVEDVLPALKLALDLQIIEEVDRERAMYRFRHALIRQALYDELLVAEARPLHRRIAAALEATAPDERLAELAYHYWQAHDQEKAAYYNELAGDRAAAVLAYRDALLHYDRALATGALDGAHRAQVAERFAGVLLQCGFGDRATRSLEEALTFYTGAGDAEHAAQACWSLGSLKLELGDAVGHLQFERRALELVHDDPTSPAFFPAHVELMRRFAAHHWDPALAQEHAVQAERAAVQAPRPASLLVDMKMALDAFLGRPSEARARTEAGVERAIGDGALLSAIRGWSNFAAVMELAGESEQASAGFAHALELMQRSGVDSLTGYWTLVEFAQHKFNLGDLQGARELVERSIVANVELPTFRLYVARVGIPVGLRLDLDELVARCSPQHLVEQALHASVPAIIGVSAAFAEGLEAAGKTEAARSLLAKAIDALERAHAQPPPGDTDLLLLGVAKWGADADVPRARKLLDRVVSDSAVHSSPAILALFEAYQARRAGERERSAEKADEAAAKFDDIGWPLYQAEALELAGRLERALDLYRTCGDQRDARRLDAKLNPVNRRGRAKSDLTAREREICDLLIKGKTNKAIAEQLVVSERTVESHVSSILTKMGAASRAELIAKLKP